MEVFLVFVIGLVIGRFLSSARQPHAIGGYQPKSKYKPLTEGKVRKGGINTPPTTQCPLPPKGQGGTRRYYPCYDCPEDN